MTNRTVTLQMPEEVYELAQQVAEESHISLESVVSNSVTIAYGPTRGKPDLKSFETFSDEKLWRVVWRPLSVELEIRLDELSDLGDRGKLTDAQRAELKDLVAEVNRFVLIRSKALAELKKRGHDIESYLEKAE